MTQREVYMTPEALAALMEQTAEVAVLRYREQEDPEKDLVSQREVWRRFGRAWVQSRVRARQLDPVQIGPHANSTIYYSIKQVTALRAAEKQARLMYIGKQS